MLPIKIDLEKCKRCINKVTRVTPCIADCPADCIAWEQEKEIPYVSYPDECSFCGNCRISCPHGAIEIIFPLSMLL